MSFFIAVTPCGLPCARRARCRPGRSRCWVYAQDRPASSRRAPSVGGIGGVGAAAGARRSSRPAGGLRSSACITATAAASCHRPTRGSRRPRAPRRHDRRPRAGGALHEVDERAAHDHAVGQTRRPRRPGCGVEIPKPTASGARVRARSRAIRPGSSAPVSRRAPVTPVTATQ